MTPKGTERERMVTFQELGEIQSAERGSTALTRLPDQFYEKASTYLRSLLAEIENCSSENMKEPDETYYRLSEDYRRSKDLLERIYSTRERKIVLAALNSSRGINQKTDEMVHDEEELYFSLKVELEDIRERILRYDRFHRKPSALRPETGINTTTDDFVETTPETPEKKKVPAEAPVSDRSLADLEELKDEVKREESPPEEERSSPNALVVVRALKDIEPFVGPDDFTVSLKKEDVASLPESVASILIQGGMAETVEEA